MFGRTNITDGVRHCRVRTVGCIPDDLVSAWKARLSLGLKRADQKYRDWSRASIESGPYHRDGRRVWLSALLVPV